MKVMGNKFQSAILQRKTEWEKGQGNKTKQNKLERPKELEEEIKKKKNKPIFWHNPGNNENSKGYQTYIKDNL